MGEAAHTKTLDNISPGIYPARKGRSAVATDHVKTPNLRTFLKNKYKQKVRH
jgi:hypothetical protein